MTFYPKRRFARRKFAKKVSVKKAYKKSYRPSRSMTTHGGFPQTRRITMKYCDSVPVAGIANSLSYYLFSANSIYDPNRTGGGHQPVGHDQWNLFYNHYVVVGSKFKCTFSSSVTGASNSGMTFGIMLDDSSTAPVTNSISHLIESRKSKYLSYNFASSTASRLPVITQTYSAKKFFNVADVKDNFTRIGADFGVDPADEAYFRVWFGMNNVLDTQQSMNLLIEVDYIVFLSEPKELPQS